MISFINVDGFCGPRHYIFADVLQHFGVGFLRGRFLPALVQILPRSPRSAKTAQIPPRSAKNPLINDSTYMPFPESPDTLPTKSQTARTQNGGAAVTRPLAAFNESTSVKKHQKHNKNLAPVIEFC